MASTHVLCDVASAWIVENEDCSTLVELGPFRVQLSPVTTNIQTYIPGPGSDGIFVFVSANICVTQLCAASEA